MSSKDNIVHLPGAKLNESKVFKFNVDKVEKNEKKKERNKIFWIDKYAPTNTNLISSNRAQILKIKTWLNDFYKNRTTNSCIVILGVHGIGKTLIARLLAKECGYNEIYFNSYTSKKEVAITSRVMNLYKNKSIAEKKKHCVIIDESETISLT